MHGLLSFVRAIASNEYIRATLGYVLILLLFLAPFVFQGKIFASADYTMSSAPWRLHVPPSATPRNSIRTDDGISEYPRKVKYYNAVHEQGGLPNWDSYKLAGYPFYEGIGQATVFTPLFAWIRVIPPAVFTGLYAFARLLLAGIAMYVFGRTLKISPTASFFGGLVFMLSGPMVVWLTSILADMAFAFPALFACIEGLVSTGRKGWAIAIPPIVGWMFLLSYPPGLVYLSLIVAAYAAVRLLQTRRDRSAGQSWMLFLLMVGSALLGLGIGVVGIHTAMEYLALSPHRARIMIFNALPLESILAFVYPNVHGIEAWSARLPRYPHGVVAVGGVWSVVGATTYIGLLPLVLVPLAVLRRRSSRAVQAIAGMAIVLVSVIWATPVPIHGLLARIPVVQAIVPSRLTIPLIFLLVTLAAFGFDEMLALHGSMRQRRGRVVTSAYAAGGILLFAVASWANRVLSSKVRANRVDWDVPQRVFQAAFDALQAREAIIVPLLFMVMLALVLVMLGGRVPRKATAWALVAFALVDLLSFGYGFNPMLNKRAVLPTTTSIQTLAKMAKGWRVAPMGDWVPLGLGDISSAYHIESISGYDLMDFSPLNQMMASVEPTWYPGTSAAGSSLRRGAKLPSPIIDALGVRYLVTDGAETEAIDELTRDGYKLIMRDDIRVFENDAALPRAWSVARVVGALSREEQLVTIREPNWDPRQVASSAREFAGSYTLADVRLADWKQGDVTLNVRAGGRCFVVLSEMSIPQWKATIDGAPVKVATVDYGLLGVRVPKGTHVVRFWYESPGFAKWTRISAAFLVLWVLLSAAFLVRTRVRPAC